jgi:hypothetical protein
MEIGSAGRSALQGILNGMAGVRRNAAEIAGTGTLNNSTPDRVVHALVDMKVNSIQVQSSARALQTVHQTLGSLLDITV